MYIKFNGATHEVDKIKSTHPTPTIHVDGCEYYIFLDRIEAGEATRLYWKDMANNDPSEFICMVGENTLVKWALNQYAGPGQEQVRNLEEWLALTAEYPEEQWAGYDGEEVEIERISPRLSDDLGFLIEDFSTCDAVMYRWN